MARYEHLPLYKAVYDLNLYFYKLSRGFPKDFKYGLAQEIRHHLSRLLDDIIVANNTENKAKILARSLILIERLKNKYRLLGDLGVVKSSSYECFFRQLIEISKQFEKWQSWSEKSGGRGSVSFSTNRAE